MTLEQVRDILQAAALTAGPLDREVVAVSASDLLSDVLAFTPPRALLLTGLVSSQAVRTAELVDAAGVCFVAGMQPDRATVEMAASMDIPLLCSTFSMFEACGRLYAEGLRGGEKREGQG